MNYLTSNIGQFAKWSMIFLCLSFASCKDNKNNVPEGGTCGTCPACEAGGTAKIPSYGQHTTCTDCPAAELGSYSSTIKFFSTVPFVRIYQPGRIPQVGKGDLFIGLGAVPGGRITLAKGEGDTGMLSIVVNENVSFNIALTDMIPEGEHIRSFNFDASKSTVSYNFPSFTNDGLSRVVKKFVKTFSFDNIEVDGHWVNEFNQEPSKFYSKLILKYSLTPDEIQSLQRIFSNSHRLSYERCELFQATLNDKGQTIRADIRDPLPGEVRPEPPAMETHRLTLEFTEIEKQ